MCLTRKQGKFFAQRPSYPEGSKGIARLSWRLVVVIVVVLAILIGGGYLIKHQLDKDTDASEKTPVEKVTPAVNPAGEPEPAGAGG